jgi:hypothetical protein
MFTMKGEVVGRPSVVSDELVPSIEQKFCKTWRFTISEFCDETWISFVNAEPKGPSKQWMHTSNKTKKFKQTLSACQKADGNCFLGQEMSTDGGIHVTRDHDNVRSVLRNTKKMRRAIQNIRRGMLTYGIVFLHDDARPHTSTAGRTRPLL